MATRIKIRRDIGSDWTSNNPILAEGELGYVTDAASDAEALKIGDGTTAWNSLSYFTPGSGGSSQTENFNWRFSTNTTAADPGSGFFRANNSTPSLVTELYVDSVCSETGLDMDTIFTIIDGQWSIYIQQTTDSTKFAQYSTSGQYTDNGGWWTIPVTYIQSGSGGALSNNAKCTFYLTNKNSISVNRTLNINGVSQDLSDNREWRTGLADTGVLTYTGASTNTSTTINVGAVTGWIIDNETNPAIPTKTYVTYGGASGVTVPTVGTGLASYLLLNSSGNLVFQNTFPTSAERKSMIYLSKIGHPSGSITTVGNEPDFILSPIAQLRDLYQAIGFVNDGVIASANGANLSLNTSSGNVHRLGGNFISNDTSPNEIAVAAQSPASFLYRTRTGVGGGFVTLIDPTNYDVAGTITAIGGSSNQATNQYIYSVPGLGFIVQYGQTVYSTLTNAISGIGRESFTIYPSLINNAILIGIISVTKGCTALNDSTTARFFIADKFGQSVGSTSGVSIATLQTAYDNSVTPEIVTNTTLGAVSIKRGSAADTDSVLDILNGAGSTTASILGNGNATFGTITSGTWNGSTVGVIYGGTGLATVAPGSVLGYNSTNTATAITSVSGLKVLQNDTGSVSWASSTGTGNVVYSTSPTLVTPNIGVATGTSLAASGLLSGSNIAESGTAIKYGSTATLNGTDQIAIGGYTVQGGSQRVAIWGTNAKANSASVQVHLFGSTLNNAGTALNNINLFGYNMQPTQGSQIGIGRNINQQATGIVAILPNSGASTYTITGAGAVVIGDLISLGTSIGNSTIIGKSAIAADNQTNMVIIGNGAKGYLDATYGSSGSGHVAIGEVAFAGSWRATAIGSYSQALAVSSNAFGYGSQVTAGHGTVIGRGGYNPLGASTVFYNGTSGMDFYFGGVGATWTNTAMPGNETPDLYTGLNAGTTVTRLSGITGKDYKPTPTLTNTKGGHIQLEGGASTGTATGGEVRLATSPAGGASNNNLNAAVAMLTLKSDYTFNYTDTVNNVYGTTTGTKHGTATSQKQAFWNATPIVQPTTAVAAATFVANTSGIVNDSATFDGYTIGQVVKALRNIGLLA